jgi:hypothetical protein
MNIHRKKNPSQHQPYAPCTLEKKTTSQGIYSFPACPCSGGISEEHGGRKGITLFLVPPGNVAGLADDIRKASRFLNVQCEQASMAGSPSKYAPLSQLKQETDEVLAKTVVVCSKSLLASRYFFKGRLFRDKKGNRLNSNDLNKMSPINVKTVVPVARIVVDEAHVIRSPRSQFLNALCRIPCPVWFMTGSACNLTPKDILGIVNVWQTSNGGQYLKNGTHGYRLEEVKTLANRYQKIDSMKATAQELPDDVLYREDELEVMALGGNQKDWHRERSDIRSWLAWRKRKNELEKLVDDYSGLCSKLMIIRTNNTRIWGKRLIKIPPNNHQEITVKFTKEKFQRAFQEDFQIAKEEVRAVFNERGQAAKIHYLGLFRMSRICASVPMLRIAPEFREKSLVSSDIDLVQLEQGACPFANSLNEIVASSEKLQWLRKFVRGLQMVRDNDTGVDYPEKLVVFAGIPIVAYIIWLVCGVYFLSDNIPD